MSRTRRALEQLGIGVIGGGLIGYLLPFGALVVTLSRTLLGGEFGPVVVGAAWFPIVAIITSMVGAVTGAAAWAFASCAVLVVHAWRPSVAARAIAAGLGAMIGAAVVMVIAATMPGLVLDPVVGALVVVLAGGLAAALLVVDERHRRRDDTATG